MVTERDLEQQRTVLLGHCYRMLGSVMDADDAVQETLIRAWKSRDRFEARSSVRTWLYRIATNVCLDFLAQSKRRVRPMDLGTSGFLGDPLVERPHSDWVEAIPDSAVLPEDASPAELAILRQSIRLAFVAALQYLPARQRAALLLTEVLGCSASEAAKTLETSVSALHSALQRARATLSEHLSEDVPGELSEEQTKLLERYVDAFLRYDVPMLTSLMHEDATLSMPPYSLWLRGPENINKWLSGPGKGCQNSRLLPIAACASPAYAQYRNGGREPWAIIVMELRGNKIGSWNAFLNTEQLFPRFGLPNTLEPSSLEISM
jgi:RNA polymerase sigma-70 factor, ECF subfamily